MSLPSGGMKRIAAALITLAAAAAVAAPAAPAAPVEAAKLKRCGTIAFGGTKVKIVVIRRTSCKTAIRTARRYDRSRSTGSWACALSHGDSRYHGYKVGFVCASGGTSGDLRKWPHAFLGAV
jgi:hypothetical protein